METSLHWYVGSMDYRIMRGNSFIGRGIWPVIDSRVDILDYLKKKHGYKIDKIYVKQKASGGLYNDEPDNEVN